MSWQFWRKMKNRAPGPGLDFSHVTAREHAERLVAEGHLEKVLVLPELFGGDDSPPNVTYVPIGLADAKATI